MRGERTMLPYPGYGTLMSFAKQQWLNKLAQDLKHNSRQTIFDYWDKIRLVLLHSN